MATITLKAGMVWKGAYDASVTYDKLDVVCNADKTQIAVCKQGGSGIPLTNSNYWDVSIDASGIIALLEDALAHGKYTMKIGSVTTGASSSATIVNNHQTHETILNLVLEKGEKGDKGDKGEKGDKGDKGEKGTSDFVIVDDHSGAGDDPNKIYIPGADSEKETHDSIMVIPATENGASAKLKGTTNVVRAAKAVAFGDYNTIESRAYESIVAGRMNLVGAPKAVAFGNVNWADATNAFASGGFNNVAKNNSYAEGTGNYVNGQVAHMEGNSTLQITLTGAANVTTYTITETLPPFFIGLPVFYAVSPENNDGVAIFTYATINAIDVENNTITLSNTLSASVALENVTARVLCATTQLKASHVEGRHNFIILNDALTENPLQDTIINDLFNAEKEVRLQGGHVEGFGNVIAGKYSHAEGSFNLVNNLNAHAEGAYNKALGGHSHAEGYYTIAEGNVSHAEGYYTIARGARSSAKGAYSVAIGYNTEASGVSSVAVGNNSHAEGSCNESHGAASHAEGFCNTAWGSCSHAGGDGSINVVLTGDANATTYNVNIQPKDTWVGRLIKPDNNSSNAVIYISAIDVTNKTITVTETLDAENPITAAIYLIALGGAYHANSFTHGKGVVTGGSEQAVFGRYNLAITNALFVVGNGTSYDNPSNAFYIDVNGNVYIAGNIVSTQIQQLESRIAALEAALNNNSNN